MAFFEDKKERLSRFLSETSFFISSTCNRLDRILRETIRGAHPGNMFCFGFSTRRKATPKMDIEGGVFCSFRAFLEAFVQEDAEQTEESATPTG